MSGCEVKSFPIIAAEGNVRRAGVTVENPTEFSTAWIDYVYTARAPAVYVSFRIHLKPIGDARLAAANIGKKTFALLVQ